MQIDLKEDNYTNKRSLKERLEVDMQNRVRNVTMTKATNTALAGFRKTETWHLIRIINKAVVEPQKELT